MNRQWALCIISILLLSPGCRKEEGEVRRVPNVPVNIFINVNQPAYFNLQTPGGWEYVSGGFNGILIYRVSPDEFRAFDRQCTWDIDESGRIEVTEDNITALHTACESTFLIVDGSVTGEPAFVPLTEYQTNFNTGTNILTINN